jgi:hypothetical protein
MSRAPIIAGAEEGQRGEEVHDPDALVVGGRQPADQPLALAPHPVEEVDVLLASGTYDRGHYLSSSR